MIDILIPVLGRPHNVQPLLESLSPTETEHTVFFICTPGDDTQIEACLASGQETWIVPWTAGRGDFAKKINWAFDRTHSPWIFQGADDIRFRAGWDTAALALARKTGKQVIGTNDLHNPQVKRGIQGTHLLFTRRYIEEQGGTHDHTGKVFCERYDHQFVDNEFCETARRRGEFAFCKQSIVEHLHPHWGLAPEDATYEKAMRLTAHDYRLFHKRMGRSRQLRKADQLAERRRMRAGR